MQLQRRPACAILCSRRALLPFLIFNFLALHAAAQPQWGDFTYTSTATSVTIHRYVGGGGNVVIPAAIAGLPVTAIGNSAFGGKSDVTGVTIPDTVTSIGNSAFWRCRGLTEFTIPGTVATIGTDAFRDCENLVGIHISVGVKTIGSSAFFECSALTEVSLPPTIESIGSEAFRRCYRLESINIPPDVTTIWGATFASCKSLASIIIHGGITSIGTNAFQRCESLRTIHIPASVTMIGDAILPECLKLEEITVHTDNPAYGSLDGVLFDKSQTNLLQYPGGKPGSYAIPGSVTTIASHAFTGCAGLTGVSIHQNVTSIGNYRFYLCGSLLTIDVHADNPSYKSIGGVLFDRNHTALLQYPGGRTGSYAIPAGVISIASSAFLNCSGLTNLTIPASVTNIGNFALMGCTGLRGIAFTGNAPTLGTSVFSIYAAVTIYHYNGSTGFAAPAWSAHSAVNMGNTDDEAFNTLSSTRTSDAFSLVIFGKAGRSYQLLRHNDLGSAEWTPVSDIGPLDTDRLLEMADPAADAIRGFYRVRMTEP